MSYHRPTDFNILLKTTAVIKREPTKLGRLARGAQFTSWWTVSSNKYQTNTNKIESEKLDQFPAKEYSRTKRSSKNFA